MDDKDKTPEGDSWAEIDSLVGRREQTLLASGLPETPLARIEYARETYRRERLDFLGRYQAGKIERKAAVEGIRAIQEAQLEATKHALARAVDVDRSRVDTIAKKYIF